MDVGRWLLRLTNTAALYLFWPGVALITWGELTPHPPRWTEHVWDKSLHFTAYFGLASMATLVLGRSSRLAAALLTLAAFGGALEILQGFTGRDPDIYDEIANCIGIAAGFLAAWLVSSILGNRRLVEAASAN
jgi:VanZ family protein